MGNQLPKSRKKKALMSAIGAGILAGAATMFIPTAVLEAITGATGLSELVPATAAPLGDKARALIAFGAGALILAIAAILLLRTEDAANADLEVVPTPAGNTSDTISISDRLANVKERLPQIKFPKMPWVKGENEVRDLSDLPSIRAADAHPDAPARRPLLATQDIPLDAGAPKEIRSMPSAAIRVDEVADVQAFSGEALMPVLQVENAPSEIPIEPALTSPGVSSTEIAIPLQPTISKQVENVTRQNSELVAVPAAGELSAILDQFEAAFQRRKAQLGKLAEIEEQTLAAEPLEPLAPSQTVEANAGAAIEVSPTAPVEALSAARPPLEIVPDVTSDGDEEMDVALNAALATLHRMNAQAR